MAMAGAQESQHAAAAIRQGRVNADGYVMTRVGDGSQLIMIPLLLVAISRYVDSSRTPELLDVVAALLEMGASPNATDHLGQSALTLAMGGVAADKNDLRLWNLVLQRNPHVGVPAECLRDELSDCGDKDCRMQCLPLFSLWAHVTVRRNMWATLMLTLKGAMAHQEVNAFVESESQALAHLARSSSFMPWMKKVRRLQAAEARGELTNGWDTYGSEDEDEDADADEDAYDNKDAAGDNGDDHDNKVSPDMHMAASEDKKPSAHLPRLLTSADLNHMPYSVFEKITGELFSALLAELEGAPGFSVCQASGRWGGVESEGGSHSAGVKNPPPPPVFLRQHTQHPSRLGHVPQPGRTRRCTKRAASPDP